MNIAQLLPRSALVHGDRPAVMAGARLLHDYRGLAARVAALAGHLRQRCGVQPGERVAIYSANCPEYLEALHAIYWCGAVSVPVNYKLHARELAHVLGDSGARVVCVSAELRDAAFAAGADPAALQVLGGPGWSQAAQGAPLAMEERTEPARAMLDACCLPVPTPDRSSRWCAGSASRCRCCRTSRRATASRSRCACRGWSSRWCSSPLLPR